ARVIATGARNRDESRGAHYKPKFDQRNDADWLRTTLAKHEEKGSVKFIREFDYATGGAIPPPGRTRLAEPRRPQAAQRRSGERRARRPRASSATSRPRRSRREERTMAETNASKGSGRLVHLKVRRQDGRDQPETRRWEEFKVPYLPQMNVNSALEQIRKDP